MTSRRRTRLSLAALTAVLAMVLVACGQGDTAQDAANGAANDAAGSTTAEAPAASPTDDTHASGSVHDPAEASASARRVPLRAGERREVVRMPAAYTPSAPTGVGTDDYRCFLLDPGVTEDSYVTGFDVLPGNRKVVHHVILFRVPADKVAAARAKDAATPGEGWTCFGGSGIGGDPGGGAPGDGGNPLDDAPWLGAWAPGGSEQVYAKGFGAPLDRGSRIVMQVHYNLLEGSSADTSATRLRLAPATKDITALQTQLFPAPVELRCRPDHADGPLCSRDAAVADVKNRFGDGPGSTADLLHLICGTDPPGEVQTCTRAVTSPETIRGVAGHMHLLGRAIRIEVNQGMRTARTLLDVPVWDFDDQGSRAVDGVRLRAGDTVSVTCRHDQSLRDRLPSFEGQPDKYVVWGEGSTDEMCLGILLVTRP